MPVIATNWGRVDISATGQCAFRLIQKVVTSAMFIRLTLLILFILMPIEVFSDQPRHRFEFKSENGKFEFKMVDGKYDDQYWSVFEVETGKALYDINEYLSPMSIFLTNDGKGIVAIDDYSEKDDSAGLEVLFFYRDGVLVTKHKLGELFDDPQTLHYSASHFRWYFYDPFSFDDTELRLQTFELIDYRFNVETGAVISKSKDTILTDESIFVSGIVTFIGDGLIEIEVCRRVYGAVPNSGKIKFRDKSRSTGELPSDSVIIENGKLKSFKNVRLNHCNL